MEEAQEHDHMTKTSSETKKWETEPNIDRTALSSNNALTAKKWVKAFCDHHHRGTESIASKQ